MFITFLHIAGITAGVLLFMFCFLCLSVSSNKSTERVRVTKVRYINCTEEEWDRLEHKEVA